MNQLKKCGVLLLSCLTLSTASATVFTATTITAEAHSGRTDSSGGHHDYKNKSGLGSYHYHCGGYPAHLHKNGVCPYSSSAKASNTSSSKTAAASSTTTAPSITYDTMRSYSQVFDANYYYNTYPDLQTAIGTNDLDLFTHFYNSGMAEGRKGCEDFDVNVYKENNADLQTAFGSDLKKYYDHYINSGWAEGRVHN